MKDIVNRFAVLGSPISHSRSPLIHGIAYRELNFSAKYEMFEVREENFEEFIAQHKATEWRGFSLTMPLKEIAARLIPKTEDMVKRATAVNTLVSQDGEWVGYNTDIFGFQYLFEKYRLLNESISVSILGAGGTARAAIIALENHFGTVKLFRRNPERDAAILRANHNVEIMNWSEITQAFDADLLINTLPESGIASLDGKIRKVSFAVDALYHPWPTLLGRVQSEKFLSGKDLLVAQAIRQIELFSGISFDRDEMFKKLRTTFDNPQEFQSR
jgi:shikimate dehydrogenase